MVPSPSASPNNEKISGAGLPLEEGGRMKKKSGIKHMPGSLAPEEPAPFESVDELLEASRRMFEARQNAVAAKLIR